MDTPHDQQIDDSLKLDGYDPDDPYPEHSHEALRQAYRTGYEDAEHEVHAQLPSREQIIDALVTSPLADTAGTSLTPFARAADTVLALVHQEATAQ